MYLRLTFISRKPNIERGWTRSTQGGGKWAGHFGLSINFL